MPVPNGHYGLIPRDYSVKPIGHYASIPPLAGIPLMRDADIEAAIIRKNADHSRLSDLPLVGLFGGVIPSGYQNGKGFCWALSGVSALLLVRARDNQPFKDLSPYAIACI